MSGCSPRMFLLISGDSWMILDGLCEKNERKDLGCLIMSYLRQRCSSSKFPTSTHTNCQIDGWYWYVHCSHNSLLLVPLFNSCKMRCKIPLSTFRRCRLGSCFGVCFSGCWAAGTKALEGRETILFMDVLSIFSEIGPGVPVSVFYYLGDSSFQFQVSGEICWQKMRRKSQEYMMRTRHIH
jgi:hypothetical protein